jgi:hypothetical protein
MRHAPPSDHSASWQPAMIFCWPPTPVQTRPSGGGVVGNEKQSALAWPPTADAVFQDEEEPAVHRSLRLGLTHNDPSVRRHRPGCRSPSACISAVTRAGCQLLSVRARSVSVRSVTACRKPMGACWMLRHVSKEATVPTGSTVMDCPARKDPSQARLSRDARVGDGNAVLRR